MTGIDVQKHMAFMHRRILRTAAVYTLLPLLFVAADTPGDAVQKVREGLQHFRNSEFSAAETAFAKAGEIAPENSVILYDEACAALAGNDAEQARSLFRKASLAKDVELAVKAHYNLGCLEADQARSKLGDDPTAAEGELREESINQLLTSIRSYRDVLELEQTHTDARHNIELIRLYIKHLQSQWAERDKQKARQEQNLLQFLKMIEDRQMQIRSVTKVLSQGQDSAHLRQAVMETAESLRTLQEEVAPLKQKLSEQIQQGSGVAAAQNAQPNPQDEQRQQAEQLLHQMADQIGERMLTSATLLEEKNMKSAVTAETEGLDQTNQLYMALAPYQNILQRAISEQQSVLPPESASEEVKTGPDATAEDAIKNTTNDDNTTSGDTTSGDITEDTNSNVAEPNNSVPKDFVQLLETQSRITGWSDILSLKAESELPQAEQQLESLKQSMPEETPDKTEPVKTDEEHSAIDPVQKDSAAQGTPVLSEQKQAAKDQQDQMRQQLDQLTGMVESMKRAIELAPQAAQHSAAATGSLIKEDAVEAEPEQQETLRLLKEIAEPLVNEDQQDQDQDQDKNNEDQKQDDKKDGDEDQQKKDESQDQKPEDEQQQSKQEQAESTLRKAREREREYRDKQREIRGLLQRGIKVDRDW